MVCIYCKNPTKVTNSRFKIKSLTTWRRRSCLSCGAILTSFEEYDLSTALMVKKRSGELQAFQRDKIIISIAKSIEHRKNTSQAASDLTNSVIQNVLKTNNLQKNISTKDISHIVSLVLKRYDTASAIKYLSFQNPMSTKKDVRNLLK